jgi:hypothetical protein
MSLLRRTRNEMAGAWRSLRYDVGRRTGEPMDQDREPAPDITSTGMSTFGGVAGEHPREECDEFARPPRRLVAASAFGVLAVAGAAGSYFAVVNGLGALLGDEPAGPQPYPLAAAAPTAGADTVAGSTAGMGRGATSVRRAPAVAAAPAATTGVALPATTLRKPTRSGQRPAAKPAEPGATTWPDCDCLTPPVPTPTAPPPPSPAPTTASPSADPNSSEPSPDDTASAEPSGSATSEQFRRVQQTRGD